MESGNAREPEGDEFAAELRMGEWEEREYWLDKERPQEEKDIALLKAALDGDGLRARRLAAAGADPNAKMKAGSAVAPMLQKLAMGGGSAEMARELMRLGARAGDRAGAHGSRASDTAACEGNGEVMEACLEMAPEGQRQEWLDSALCFAAFTKKGSGLVERLARLGANLEGRDIWGKSPLTSAAGGVWGSERAVRELARLGAKLESPGKGGETALMEAAASGNLEAGRALLELGADPNARDMAGQTALMHAGREKRHGTEEMAMLLLEFGADWRARDSRGRSAEEIAEEGGKRGVAAALRRARESQEQREALSRGAGMPGNRERGLGGRGI